MHGNLRHLMACALICVLASSSVATAQYPRIGYVFPAGGRQGTTFLVTVGGQFLGSWKGEYHIDVLEAHFSGGGITAEVVKDVEPMREQEANALRQKAQELSRNKSLRWFQSPLEILSEQPVRIPVGGTVEVQVRLDWSRKGQIQVDLSEPPEGITVDSASWTERGVALVLRGDAAKVQPKLKGNLMANAFLQTTTTEQDGKTREVRNLIGPLPAMPFEVVEP